MEVTHDVLEIAYYETHKIRPATVLPRPPGENWFVRTLPLGLEEAQAWGHAQGGDELRVPLFPYVTNGVEPLVAMVYAFSLGAQAMTSLPPGVLPRRLHLSLGYPLQEIMEPAGHNVFRLWLGVACLREE